jgi:hypothetical protein
VKTTQSSCSLQRLASALSGAEFVLPPLFSPDLFSIAAWYGIRTLHSTVFFYFPFWSVKLFGWRVLPRDLYKPGHIFDIAWVGRSASYDIWNTKRLSWHPKPLIVQRYPRTRKSRKTSEIPLHKAPDRVSQGGLVVPIYYSVHVERDLRLGDINQYPRHPQTRSRTVTATSTPCKIRPPDNSNRDRYLLFWGLQQNFSGVLPLLVAWRTCPTKLSFAEP